VVYYSPHNPQRSTLDRRLNLRYIDDFTWLIPLGLALFWARRQILKGQAAGR
jgi:hypothetical protein